VDTPRTVPGAADGILRTLEHFGFEWDGPVVWQSRRTDAYRAAFEQLRAAGQVFACACTRKEIADSALARDGTRRYPGTCRNGLPPGRERAGLAPAGRAGRGELRRRGAGPDLRGRGRRRRRLRAAARRRPVRLSAGGGGG
jgi:glutamyl/glutaminyl-tRNA synthetase